MNATKCQRTTSEDSVSNLKNVAIERDEDTKKKTGLKPVKIFRGNNLPIDHWSKCPSHAID